MPTLAGIAPAHRWVSNRIGVFTEIENIAAEITAATEPSAPTYRAPYSGPVSGNASAPMMANPVSISTAPPNHESGLALSSADR